MRYLIILTTLLLSQFASDQSAVAAPPITAAVFTSDGSTVILGSQAGIEIRNWPDLELVGKLSTDLEHIHDLCFSPDGRTLLVAGGSPAEEGSVQIINWSNRETIQRISCHSDVVYRIVWSLDGQSWATASGDSTCRIYSAHSVNLMRTFEGHSQPVVSLRYLPHSDLIASVGVDQTLKIWNCQTGHLLRSLDNHVGPVHEISVSPDLAGAVSIIASASDDRTVRFWQPEIGRLIRFAKLPAIARSLAWSPGGKHLFVGCDDGQIRIISSDKADIVQSIHGLDGRIHELLTNPDGSQLLAAGVSGFRRIELKNQF